MIDSSAPRWPSKPALFLDLDGTVLEFAAIPEAVVRSDKLDRVLAGLNPALNGAVAFISGRSISNVDRLLAPHRFALAGIHGLERRDAYGNLSRVEGSGVGLSKAKRRLDAWSRRLDGTLVEDKSLSVAFHFRRRPELAGELAERFDALAAELDEDLEVLAGNRVFEIKPRSRNKGQAIESFMQEPPFAGRTPVFIGDDVTDEAGFAAVNALGGVSVKVGEGETVAQSRLPDVDAVLDFLAELTESVRDEASA